MLNGLESVDFLTKQKLEKDVSGVRLLGEKKTVRKRFTRYSLTAKGATVASQVRPRSQMFRGETLFCYGQYTVIEIKRFSAPASFWGKTVSEVRYTFKARNIAGWARNKALVASSKELARDLAASSIDGKAALVLMNDGWIHEKMMDR